MAWGGGMHSDSTKNVQELMLVLFFFRRGRKMIKKGKGGMRGGMETDNQEIAWGYAVVYRK